MGWVAGIGGFVLLAAIVGLALWTRARRPSRREDATRDRATRDLYGKDSQSNDVRR